MARKTFRLEGVDELEKVFKRLPEKLRTKVILNAVRAGGRVIRNEAKARAPRDTGELARSITVATVKKKRRNENSLVRVGFKKPTSRRAHLAEYGTSTQAAQPFMRPALDTKGEAAIQAITEKVAEGMAKEAAKLASETGASRRR
ncbi:HK97 gp10 family phage protein [Hyphococcus flavus]|uniref:HK97 gp10 family phage protein n=1 Tax=Hyphococcus flavus TaxID=1866326 RepID=A0AAE9ZDH4_9PROT|nr:HK97-gp10 family putative phage morphogenesis protein [Hyphococcus flavus]WDI31595.1 HK97 gp10 family phage protein [Hyphococcus flavus]